MHPSLSHARLSLLTGLSLWAASQSLHAAPDTQAPVLRAFAVTTPTVDVGQPGATIQVNLRATDNLSGVLTLALSLSSPDGQQTVERWYNLPAPRTLTTLSLSVGAPTGQGGLNGHSAAGVWRVRQLQLIDANDNAVTYRYPALAAMGRATFHVTSPQADTTVPELVSGSLNISALSLSSRVPGTQKPPYVSATLRLRDPGDVASAISGIRWAQLVLCKPDGSGYCLERIDLAAEAPLLGLPQPALQVGGALPEGLTPGEFHIFSVTVLDMAGNSHWMQSTDFQGEVDFSQYFPRTTLTLRP